MSHSSPRRPNEYSTPYLGIIAGLSALVIILGIVFWAVQGKAENGDSAGTNGPAQPALVNINTATFNELVAVPGIGPATANRIIARRDQEPFEHINQMLDVPGVNMPNFEQMKRRISVR